MCDDTLQQTQFIRGFTIQPSKLDGLVYQLKQLGVKAEIVTFKNKEKGRDN
ncbi:hypothetical protein GCM10012290_11780 [Halolactibacillus alkaliphilus]|uniref:Uncharacterized protein n=1 Tax=Halolactibacillus alkaliphilus TaxID=442899 RepID=A0A511X0Y6_9BACI|nr:hypothetical protein [Halolactibacillus alkaliphilus]GEN56560.1 hypothetical protein HAL01_10240 [Halolactibacillus alkaliphilus]GGN69267.1 hypothetical protein GCM10012290_11780 [Halolactibacillus alkaliphilus]SFO75181.1 hypothetical protein SAMN05720591_10870 [Halolactibacillus alkaliphilus]